MRQWFASANALIGISLSLFACSSGPAEGSSGSAGGGGSGGATSTTTAVTSSSTGGGGGGCASPAGSTEYDLDTDTGKIYGTLTNPEGCGPSVVVLFHAGSGPTDRDGNDAQLGLSTDCYKDLAEVLASKGYASVRYDKRGVAASVAAVSDPSTFVFDDYVADYEAWIQKLRGDARFAKVVLAGHSEGSLIAILAAEAQPVDAVISLEGPGRPAGEILRTQLAAAYSGQLLEEADQLIDDLEAGMLEDTLPADFDTTLDELFAPVNQRYLIDWFHYDPSVEIAKLTVPVEIVQGTTDSQVAVSEAMLLAAADPSAKLDIVTDMAHVLKTATSDAASQQAAYTDPTVPLAPGLVADVPKFLATIH